MAIDTKLFTVAGTSTFNGTNKVRYANDLATRIKLLTKAGNSNIVLVELPEPMTKEAVVAYLKANPVEGMDQDALNVRDEVITARNTPKVPRVKAEKPAKVAKTPHVKATRVDNPVVEEIVAAARKGGLRARAAKQTETPVAQEAQSE